MLQVARYKQNQLPIGDLIYDEGRLGNNGVLRGFNNNLKDLTLLETHQFENLLVPIFKNGKLIYKLPTIHQIRERTLKQLALFEQIDLKNYSVGLEERLFEEKKRIIENLNKL